MPSFSSKSIQAHISSVRPDGSTVFLALRRSPDIDVYPGLWQTVTGTIETDETALQTALREVREETGLKILKAWTVPYITKFFNTRADCFEFAPVFGFLADFEEHIELSDEHSEYKWLGLDQAIDLYQLPSHKEALQVFSDFILNNPAGDMFLIKSEMIGR